MAHFYGTLKGRGNSVHASGTKASGISASAQSWDGSVTVELAEHPNGTWVSIQVCSDSGVGGHQLWAGYLSELLTDNAKVTVGGAK